MTIICTGNDIHINGIALNRIDDSGCEWLVTDLDGWWGLPDAEIPDDPRPFHQDGSYYTAGRYASRVVTLTGYIVPKSAGPAGVAEARDTLNRAINLVRQAGILQVDESPPKQAWVQITGRPLTRITKASNVVEFNIQLRSSDPRKYSVTKYIKNSRLPVALSGRLYPKSFNYTYGSGGNAGTVTINNEGSYDTYGTLRINGPVTNPQVEHVELGRFLKFNTVIGVGDFYDIDLLSKTVLLNGFESRRITLLPTSRWFNFQPGINTLKFNGIQHVPARPYSRAAINMATDPRATTTDWTALRTFSEGTYSFITAASDGPLSGLSSYVRKTWTTAATTNANTGFAVRRSDEAPWSCTPGQPITVSAYMRNTSMSTKNMYARIVWTTASGASVGSTTGEIFPVNSGSGWHRVNVTGTAPMNAVGFTLQLDVAAGFLEWAVGDKLDATGALIESGTGTTEILGTNLCTNPSFEVNLIGWTNVAGGGTVNVTREISSGYLSPSFSRMTWTTAASVATAGHISNRFNVSVGQKITGSAYVRPSVTQVIKPRIYYYDETGTEIAVNLNGTSTTANSNVWTRVSIEGAEVPLDRSMLL